MSDFPVDRKSPFAVDPTSPFAVDRTSPFAVAKTFVLWNVDDCPIPPGLSATDVLRNIKTVLKESGHVGGFLEPVSITPYGHNMDIMNDDFAGIPNHIECAGYKEKTIRLILVGLFKHAIINRYEPLNLMLIMGDILERKDFFRVFRLLQSRLRYRILLAQPPNPSGQLSFDRC